MKIVYILQNLDLSAPNKVIFNIIQNIDAKIEIISLGQSSEQNYSKLANELNINIFETRNIFEISKICDQKIVHLNGYHPNIVGFFLKILTDCKLVSTCHSNELTETKSHNFKGFKKIKSQIKHAILPFLYNLQNITIAVSGDAKTYLSSIKVANIELIHNGIEEINPKNLQKFSALTFCQIGHIMNLKNQLFSLRVIEFLKQKNIDVKLNFFGKIRDNNYKIALDDFIKTHNLTQNVEFFGSLTPELLFENVEKSHFCMMPSFSEGLPLSILESLSLGVPCIVSLNGGMKEAVFDNINGLVISLDSENVLDKIFDFCTKSDYEALSLNSINIIKTNFSAKTMAQKYLDVYCKLK